GQPRAEPGAGGAVLELPGVDPGPDLHALSLAGAPAGWLGAAGLPAVAGGGDGVLSDAVQDPLCRWSGAVSAGAAGGGMARRRRPGRGNGAVRGAAVPDAAPGWATVGDGQPHRSEERRVGKEGSGRRATR